MLPPIRPDDDGAGDAGDLLRVRQLLLGVEYDELLALKQCLNDPEAFSQKLASVITEALKLRSKDDQSLSEVLGPTIESAIQGSIAADPRALAESLYPVMGPAIRKSISETLSQMLADMNQLLEQSLSPQALRWRFNAWRTGRSYSEIALINTLEYQVEQVFLIHGETSLLIQHLVADLAITKDPDMVSSMLSAIQDYIVDSFAVGEGEALNSMSLGDLTVVLEKGPRAVIAAVVRGKIPENLRNTFKVALEDIHQRAGSRLQDYSGDPDDYLDLEPYLRSCLKFQKRNQAPGEKTKREVPWLALASILLLSGVGMWFWFQSHQLAENRALALAQLAAEPGIVIISSRPTADNALRITGLRDPLARDPADITRIDRPGIETPGIDGPDTLRLTFAFEPYLSIEPAIVLRRATERLQPPASASLQVDGRLLVVTGEADVSWVAALNQNWPSIPGIDALQANDLIALDPVAAEIETLAATIEAATFYFELEATEPYRHTLDLPSLAAAIQRLTTLANTRSMTPTVSIFGATDETGTFLLNDRLARKRAETLQAALISQGIPASQLQYHALHDYPDVDPGPPERKVMFKLSGLAQE